MSGMVRHRRRWPRILRVGLLLVLGAVLTTTLGMAFQVRQVRVEGTRRFALAEVEAALQPALGSPSLTLRATDLRDAVLAVPWVEEASVRVSLDGIVHCMVREREPVAVAIDGSAVNLVDRTGHLMGPPRGDLPELELADFAPFPEERAALLAALPGLEEAAAARVQRAVRMGFCNVALTFHRIPCPILVDPTRPDQLRLARRVLEAWQRDTHAAPLRLDARVDGRVAVLPAPEPMETPS
jgi:cell division septal protein FtsQ